MNESKGMEITSAALELKPWWVEKKRKEAVKHLENLRVSPLEDFQRKLEASQMLHSSSPRFAPPVFPVLAACVMEDPRPSDLK